MLEENSGDADATSRSLHAESDKRKSPKGQSPPGSAATSKPVSTLAQLAASRASKPPTSSLASLASSKASKSTRPSSLAGGPSVAVPSAAKPSLAALAAAKRTPPSASASSPAPALPGASKLSQLARARDSSARSLLPQQLVAPPSNPTKPLSKLALKVLQAKDAAAPSTPSSHHTSDSHTPGRLQTDTPSTPLLAPDEDNNNDTSASEALSPPIPSLVLSSSPFAKLLVPRSLDVTQTGILERPSSSTTIPVFRDWQAKSFAFDTPSPDDLVLHKREGTRLAVGLKASVMRGQAGG